MNVRLKRFLSIWPHTSSNIPRQIWSHHRWPDLSFGPPDLPNLPSRRDTDRVGLSRCWPALHAHEDLKYYWTILVQRYRKIASGVACAISLCRRMAGFCCFPVTHCQLGICQIPRVLKLVSRSRASAAAVLCGNAQFYIKEVKVAACMLPYSDNCVKFACVHACMQCPARADVKHCMAST